MDTPVKRRESWVLEEDIEAGGTLRLPIPYFPKGNNLLLIYENIPCTPSSMGEPQGQYRYDEVGDDPDVASFEVVLRFDASAGEVFDAIVMDTNPTMIEVHTFTSSGTFTPPYKGFARVRGCAGGGGGGGGLSYPGIACGGGSSGATIDTVIEFTSLDPVPIIIGAGGTGGYNTSNGGGGRGGSTSFGDYFILSGGVGGGGRIHREGESAVEGLTGGWPSGSGSNPGCPGDGFYYWESTYPFAPAMAVRSGCGGASPFGVAGYSVQASGASPVNGKPASGYGAGGGGACPMNGGWAQGGKGAPGYLEIIMLAQS